MNLAPMNREDARQMREITKLCNEKVTVPETQRRSNILSRLDEGGEMSTKAWAKGLEEMQNKPETPKTRRGQEHSNNSKKPIPKPAYVSSLPSIKKEPDLERPAKKVKAKGTVAREVQDDRTTMPETDREISDEPKPKRVKRDQAFYDCWKAAKRHMLDSSRGKKAAK